VSTECKVCYNIVIVMIIMCFKLYMSADTRWRVDPHTAAVIAGSRGNDTCKCHIWPYMIYLAHAYLVSIYSMLYWMNKHAAMMI
jgi:hypothetical protein